MLTGYEWWRGKDSNLQNRRWRIYSPLQLPIMQPLQIWWEVRDLNSYDRSRGILSPLCIPIPSTSLIWWGMWDSNSHACAPESRSG